MWIKRKGHRDILILDVDRWLRGDVANGIE